MADTEVLLIGFGGAVGALIARFLLESQRVRLTAVVRSNHDAIASKGILLKSQLVGEQLLRPHVLCRTLEEASGKDITYDFVIVATKFIPEVQSTESLLAPLLSRQRPAPTVVLLQNGIGIESSLQAAYPDLCIISANAWVNSVPHFVDGQVVIAHGAGLKLDLGLFVGADATASAAFPVARREEGAARIKALDGLLRSEEGSKIVVTFPADIQQQRWCKYFVNAAFGSLCCISRLPVDVLGNEQNWPSTYKTVKGLTGEALAVGRACGIDLTEEQRDFGCTWPIKAAAPGFMTSLGNDLLAGRVMELEALFGNVLKMGAAHGIECPRLEQIYAALLPHQHVALKALAAKDVA